MRFLRAAGRFGYDFVIGDDWRIAVAVVTALLVGVVLLTWGVPATVTVLVTAGLVALGFTAAMVIGVRRTG
jgi:hypothetical protein